MSGLVVETVRPGVVFIPEAAAAFRRADAQVYAEFGRGIDVNSTYRSWADQMVMFTNWEKWIQGKGPRPAHSKAVHPSESFHVAGTALDSDDWRVPRIVAILAENGFIRNRLHVPGEQHHFEYIRALDRNRGKPTPTGTTIPSPAPESEEDDDMRTPAMFYTTKNDLPATASNPIDTYIITDTNGYCSPFSGVSGDYASGIAQQYGITVDAKFITRDHARRIERDCAAMRPRSS